MRYYDLKSGDNYPATKAQYCFFLNWKAGLFIADGNFGSAHNVSENGSKHTLLPDLRQWSDVAFLQWKLLDNLGMGHAQFRYILQASIINKDTIAVLSHILVYNAGQQNIRGKSHMQWPGISFPMASDEVQAILGTPNGKGVAWLLAQHCGDEVVAGKVLEKVTVFFSRLQKCPCDREKCETVPMKLVNVLFCLKNGESGGEL
ncbi:hypothetical protein EK21DRAFT_111577 [Setomelanomma holmii]|uniref:Uncharacterized protein n=1 Tax=Setomelanomma holmii TaxID=210430 RepID=A0A9P4H9D6_9PLEO|nr:hypothetical protein EK21DRAFT_111577 [Setomelanomma holmii]